MSRFTEYWKNIDNTPGTLESLKPAQLADVKRMVKAAFHAGHGMYQKRIADLKEQLQICKLIKDSKIQEVAELEAIVSDLRARIAELKAVLEMVRDAEKNWRNRNE